MYVPVAFFLFFSCFFLQQTASMPAFVSPVLIYSDGYSVEISWSGAGGVGVGGGGNFVL